MKAEIISIGTELLLGQIVDTNSAYLAGELPALGVDLYYISQVGDNTGRIAEVLRRAWARSDLILTTGGLGPTDDDVTRDAVAQALGEEMRIVPELEEHLRQWFSRRTVAMPERNLKQATLVPSAQSLPNPVGTAPGWWVEKEGHIIAVMPGPPREMTRMWRNEVVPRLRERVTGEIILSRTLKTYGVGEGTVDEMVSPHSRSSNPTIGTYAKPDGVHLRLTAKAPTSEAARALIAPVEEKLREIFGDRIWGADDETLEGAVGDALRSRKLTLATMESCTGGLLASTITDMAGSSDYFKGGLVTYTNEAKIAYGVPAQLIEAHGAVSQPVAQAMAQAACRALGADVGVSVTGVAGPSSLEGKPPGTVFIGLAWGEKARAHDVSFPGQRAVVKRRATTAALFLLRRFLQQG
ncbi:MAG: competence/damage-inducible protein A [Chloroflexi bacterium]|nr:competence/damage-inducible protein A [Chloroflexota bacterium]